MCDKEDEEKTKKNIDEFKKKGDEKINIEYKNIAFQIYKIDSIEAKETENGIVQNSEDLNKSKNEAKVFMENCNTYKKSLEETKIKLNEKRS